MGCHKKNLMNWIAGWETMNRIIVEDARTRLSILLREKLTTHKITRFILPFISNVENVVTPSKSTTFVSTNNSIQLNPKRHAKRSPDARSQIKVVRYRIFT